jgi:hypothetical protein
MQISFVISPSTAPAAAAVADHRCRPQRNAAPGFADPPSAQPHQRGAILKHTYDLSEVLCERWVENSYYQHFCGNHPTFS